jgi:pyruvate decarboxylase
MVPVEVDSGRLDEPLTAEPDSVDQTAVKSQAEALLALLYNSRQSLLLVDRGGGVPLLKDEINDLARASQIPSLAMPSGAGIVDNSLPSYFGVHSGPVGQIDTMPYVESSDVILAFGPLFSDTQTLGWSTVPDLSKTVIIQRNSIGDVAVDSKAVLRELLKHLQPSRIGRRNERLLGSFRHVKSSATDVDACIDQTSFYLRLAESGYFVADDVILLGNGTPIIGGRDFVLPPRAQTIASGMSFSIGHMLPAAQGAALAQTRGRTILFDGDGSFQVTVQELSTIIRERLNVTIWIVNNGGYAYERYIHGMHESYNDIAPWNYLLAPSFFAASPDYPVETHRIETWRHLDALLATDSFHDGKGLKMVDVIVGKYDVPHKFKHVFQRAGELL